MGCCGNEMAMSCCPDKKYVQDKVCTPWNGTVDDAALDIVVYNNNVSQNIYGSGYVQYDVGPADITLTVLDAAGGTLSTTTLAPGTSTSFTYRRFSTIQLTLPATAGTYQGEFCITPRYAI
ncbi:MAG: hypothetical protein C6W55_07435 [Thermobacillus sp.]|uniref:DUF3992 domain-containing protein n=1 Tax=Thermobacillus sp. TaxID=2108467 RepID=UPI000E3B0746|nr:S-Ena type endospore appendage [Thermobacillus sp.]REK56572.1 MAG: hypothetical protein C6W55_07435 [Thermobacillus sp.]